MDLDEFRTILSNSGVNVWEIIDAAISVASSDYGKELKDRRDLIVERLYAATSRCENCDVDGRRRLQVEEKHKVSIEMGENQKQGSPFSTPGTVHGNDDVEDGEEEGGGEDERVRDLFGDLFDDDEETKILRIKEQIEDPDQSEDSLVELLQGLADMDITFKALKETDIGRHVNHLRKHPSNEVRRLVKQLVRKWKDLVDEWVKLKETDEHASSTLLGGLLMAAADGDSPLQSVPPRNAQNGYHQVPDFAYSPNPHNGSSGSDKNYSEPEPKPKPKPIPRRDAPAKQSHSLPISASAPPIVKREQKESNIDERLASARKRLHENYQEAQNAKKQRTIQVMDIHEIPKPKNTFFAKNKGGSQGRHR
ncbi:probable mediator of RNA polymerase II transcription subunit 26c isoform X1 [Rhododendron vialii]|uniref:probable mediator of RNA polymerase II transcription subunit 26c isoform X1 n=1 Tax=Rhododendron vialii TaxID=182163 RepID=UPI00265DDE93|nr:probable mediator of RNA polymerase II transcription subunit 26c isoform X1 [Rhododendron vialii]